MIGSEEKPLVSVIIPTFNSRKTFERCMQSIRQQTYPLIETIVVDRFSVDGTQEAAKKLGAKTLILNAERSAAKNHGATKCKGKFVFFLDSDMEPTLKVVENCVNLCLKKNLDAVIIPEKSTSENFLGKCRSIEKTLQQYGSSVTINIPRFFNKDVFIQLGGYDESLICGEDLDLYIRLKNARYRCGQVKSEIIHLEGNVTMREITSKAYYYGKSLPKLLEKNPKHVSIRYVNLLIFNLRNLRTWIRYGAYFVGFVIMKVTEYAAFILGFSNTIISGT